MEFGRAMVHRNQPSGEVVFRDPIILDLFLLKPPANQLISYLCKRQSFLRVTWKMLQCIVSRRIAVVCWFFLPYGTIANSKSLCCMHYRKYHLYGSHFLSNSFKLSSIPTKSLAFSGVPHWLGFCVRWWTIGKLKPLPNRQGGYETSVPNTPSLGGRHILNLILIFITPGHPTQVEQFNGSPLKSCRGPKNKRVNSSNNHFSSVSCLTSPV